MLQTHASAIFSVLAFILTGFRQFSTAHTNKICMHFRFDILSKAFSDRCLYDEDAQRITISLDGRPRRIELYAFSNEFALVCVDWA